MANFYQSQTVEGLSTVTIKVPTSDTYKLEGKINTPSLQSGSNAQSSVVVTISQTGLGTIYTGPAGAKGFQIKPVCSANDVLTIVLSSANAVDQGTNMIKSVISISEGV